MAIEKQLARTLTRALQNFNKPTEKEVTDLLIWNAMLESGEIPLLPEEAAKLLRLLSTHHALIYLGETEVLDRLDIDLAAKDASDWLVANN